MGRPDAIVLKADRGLRAPDFANKQSFIVTLWRPSAKATDHDTAHDTDQVQYLNNLTEPERVVLVLQGQTTRGALMKKLDLRQRGNFMKITSIRPLNKVGLNEPFLINLPVRNRSTN